MTDRPTLDQLDAEFMAEQYERSLTNTGEANSQDQQRKRRSLRRVAARKP